ncbi:MAG: hypothetical protein SGJ02_00305 [bacterium]|nr:hypothetical protein [bacterium]
MNTAPQPTPSSRKAEFLLLLIMFGSLTIIVIGILLSVKNPDLTKIVLPNNVVLELDKQSKEFTKDILAIVLTVFGAWVGAGAAYFFGRENLQTATQGILAMRQETPQQILARTKVTETEMKPVRWTVTEETTVEEVQSVLNEHPERWFIPVVQKDPSRPILTVLNEEAIWRFLVHISSTAQNSTSIPEDKTTAQSHPVVQEKSKVKDLIQFVKEDPNLKKRLIDIYVTATLESTIAEMNNAMTEKGANLTIILGKNKEPLYFITSGDIRRFILNSFTT